MTTVVSIVEGDGEVVALPVLLRRIGEWLSPGQFFNVLHPIRVRRDQFLNREDIFRKQLQLAALKCSLPGWILIVLDADNDCPLELAAKIYAKAKEIVPDRHISVVLPKYEYEAWFIAASASLDGKRGFTRGPDGAAAETIRGAKEWLSERIPNGKYREVLDQPAFSALIDLALARENSRSFRKLCTEWERSLQMLQT